MELSAQSRGNRQPATHIDGSLVFATEADKKSEREVADIISGIWNCEVHNFGALSPIDFYATKNGRISGLLELKTRGHPSTKYPTVFLNVRKWLALLMGQNGLGTPAIFVVRFTDSIRWCKVSDIPITNVQIGGWKNTDRSRNDVEPVIHVPIESMKPLAAKDQ